MALSPEHADKLLMFMQQRGDAGATNKEIAEQLGIAPQQVDANMSWYEMILHNRSQDIRQYINLPVGARVASAQEARGPRGGVQKVWRIRLE